MLAEGTFIGIAIFLVNITGIVGASGNTGLAAHTFIAVYQNNPVIPFVRGAGGAGGNTGRVITMITKLRS